MSALHPGRPAVPPRPTLLTVALALILVTAVVSVIATVLSVTTGPPLRDQILRDVGKIAPGLPMNPTLVDQSVRNAMNQLWATMIVRFALYVWLIWKLATGRPWARVVITVVSGLGVVGLLNLRYGGGAAKALTVAWIVLGLVIIALVWTRPVSAFLTASAPSRRPAPMGPPGAPMGPPPPGWQSPGPVGPVGPVGPPSAPQRNSQQSPQPYPQPYPQPHPQPHPQQHPQEGQGWAAPDQGDRPRTVGESWPGPGPFGRPSAGPYRPERPRPDRPGDDTARS